MVNNFRQIEKYLEFKEDGDFYDLILLMRKKDQVNQNEHQSARTIKRYYIESLDYFHKKEEEIINLCELFNCRAGISLNRMNHHKLALDVLVECANRIKSGHTNLSRVYDSVVGQGKSQDKRWMIDLDSKEGVEQIKEFVSLQAPYKEVIDVFPTTKGYHLLCYPFDKRNFDNFIKENNLEIDLHKTNYFALYYP